MHLPCVMAYVLHAAPLIHMDPTVQTSNCSKGHIIWKVIVASLYEFFSFKFPKPMAKFDLKTSSKKTSKLRVTGPLWGESTGHRWFPLTKAFDAEL